jgi:hypothetical protein
MADKSAKTIELQTDVNEVKLELQSCRDTRAAIPVAPSIDSMKTPETYTHVTQHQSSGIKMESRHCHWT